MAHTLDKIEVVSDYKHIQIRELNDNGTYHRRVVYCDDTLVADEYQEVKDIAEAEWTDEIKTAWTTFKAEQEAARAAESE